MSRLNGLTMRNGGVSLGSSPTSLKNENARTTIPEDDLSIKLDKSSYQNIFQDIVSIKSMLLKLNRVLSEGGSDGVLLENEKEDNFGIAELREQVTFLQQQLEQRESTVQLLQMQVNQGCERSHKIQPAPVLCNAATQTDKVRPISTGTGPLVLQNLPSETNAISNGTLRKKGELSKLAYSDNNNKQGFVRPVNHTEENSSFWKIDNGPKTAPAEKILEKVKALSFKPVEVLEREKVNTIQTKNVFKVTKIDLVLKSDNYGRTELRKT